jgi:hypothetical protein
VRGWIAAGAHCVAGSDDHLAAAGDHCANGHFALAGRKLRLVQGKAHLFGERKCHGQALAAWLRRRYVAVVAVAVVLVVLVVLAFRRVSRTKNAK